MKKKKGKNGTIHHTERHQSPWASLCFPLSFLPTLCCPFTVGGLVSTEQSSATNNNCLLTMKLLLSKEFSNVNLLQCSDSRSTMATAIFFFFFYDLGNSDIGHKSYITTSQVFSTYSPQSVSLPHIPPFESIS